MITADRSETRSPFLSLPDRPYRYRGRAGWTPEGLGPIPKAKPPNEGARRRSRDRADRLAEFARLRDGGASVAEASAALGIARRTASAYEADRRGTAAGLPATDINDETIGVALWSRTSTRALGTG